MRPIGEKTLFIGIGISLAVLITVLAAIMAFNSAVTLRPDGAVPDAGARPGISIPDTVPSSNQTPVSLPAEYSIDTAPGPGMGRIAKHIAYASQPNVSDIVVFTAYWTVPERPVYDEYIKHTVFLWCGLQQGDLGLIQPVLEWDHDDTGKYWTIACWIVNKRDDTYEVSKRLMAYPGDRIRADLRYIDSADTGRKLWYIAISDLTHQGMTYIIDYGGAVDTNRNLTVLSGVLEGTDLSRYDADLPGDVTFEDIMCKAEGGVDIPINLTGYVHPDMGQVSIEYDDWPSWSPVAIHTHNNGQ